MVTCSSKLDPNYNSSSSLVSGKKPNPKHLKMSDNIPFEIQMEIIKKVHDLKLLIRFRSVSKEWKSFIDSSEFINGYDFHLTNPNRLILRYISDYFSFEEKYICYIDDNDTLTHQQEFNLTISNLVKQFDEHSVNLVGSSHGLFCLKGEENEKEIVVIWNLSIRKSVGIVVPCYSSRRPYEKNYFGFGVCPVTNDPTIVKISYVDIVPKGEKNIIPWRVEIFTLSFKRWQMIPDSNPPPESVKLLSPQVVIDGVIYWAARDTIYDGGVRHQNYMIMSFNLITLEFKEINLPDSFTNQLYNNGFTITMLRESLVLFAIILENEEFWEPVYGVWMMVQDGDIASLTRLFVIDTDDLRVHSLHGFTKNGEFIIATESDSEETLPLVVYSPSSKHIKNLGIHGERNGFFMGSYMETLLLVDQKDSYIYST